MVWVVGLGRGNSLLYVRLAQRGLASLAPIPPCHTTCATWKGFLLGVGGVSVQKPFKCLRKSAGPPLANLAEVSAWRSWWQGEGLGLQPSSPAGTVPQGPPSRVNKGGL